MKPDIIVTTIDFERLESLIDSMPPLSDAAAELLGELQRADVVEPHELPRTVVTMDSIVRFTLGRREEEFCRRLVYPREDMDSSMISVLSPVGCALLGLSIDDSIEWLGPTGDRLVIRIIDVVHPPESAAANPQLECLM